MIYLEVLLNKMMVMIGFLTLIMTSCSTSVDDRCRNGTEWPCIPNDEPFNHLSEYGFFEGDLKELDPIEGVTPYDLNTPLFTDYAIKSRMIYIPDGERIELNNSAEFVYPEGSVLIKTFLYDSYSADKVIDQKVIETRLLIKKKDQWIGETYVWNDAQTEATRHKSGGRTHIVWTDNKGIERAINYKIPSVNDCFSCHNRNRSIQPIGPKLSNLDREFEYDTIEENQLRHWFKRGIIQDTDTITYIPLPKWDEPTSGSVNKRARAYLDVNCSSCHSATGSARNTGLYLNYEEDRLFRLGYCKTPVSAGPGTGGLKYDIVPCKPDESILLYRMNSNDPAARMPELGRTIIHEEGVELIRQWIRNMDCMDCGQKR